MELQKGVHELKLWKEFAGLKVFACQSFWDVTLRHILEELTMEETCPSRWIALLSSAFVRTTRFPNIGSEGLGKYEFPSNSALDLNILRPGITL